MAKNTKTTEAQKEKVNPEIGVEKKVPATPKVTYEIDAINMVVNYLGSRPYAEVAELIHILQSGKSS